MEERATVIMVVLLITLQALSDPFHSATIIFGISLLCEGRACRFDSWLQSVLLSACLRLLDTGFAFLTYAGVSVFNMHTLFLVLDTGGDKYYHIDTGVCQHIIYIYIVS